MLITLFKTALTSSEESSESEKSLLIVIKTVKKFINF